MPFCLTLCMFKTFHDKKLKDWERKKKKKRCQSAPLFLLWTLLLHNNISRDLNMGNLIMGVFTVWLQQREKFDGLFLESGAVRVSKKSDVEMNDEDSLLSDAARGLLSEVLRNCRRGRWWSGGSALPCAMQGRATHSLHFPPQSPEDGWRTDLYFIPGAMAHAVQPSRASVAPRGVLWSLGDCQASPVEECVQGNQARQPVSCILEDSH